MLCLLAFALDWCSTTLYYTASCVCVLNGWTCLFDMLLLLLGECANVTTMWSIYHPWRDCHTLHALRTPFPLSSKSTLFSTAQSACSVFCFWSRRVFWLTRRDMCGILSLWLSAMRVRWKVAIRSCTCWLPPIRVPNGSLWSGRCSLIWRISSAFDLYKSQTDIIVVSYHPSNSSIQTNQNNLPDSLEHARHATDKTDLLLEDLHAVPLGWGLLCFLVLLFLLLLEDGLDFLAVQTICLVLELARAALFH